MTRALRLLLPALLLAIACAARPETCEVCGREIHPQVRAELILKDGHRVRACCPRCALHDREGKGAGVREIRVTDRGAGSLLPLERAWMVEGSDETPCLDRPPLSDPTSLPMHLCYDRCVPSLIAFRDESAARAFALDHGGSIRPPGSYSAGP
jgi:hypothetical protein